MNLFVILFVYVVFNLHEVNCELESDLFVLVGSHSHDYDLKKIYLSRTLEESWQNSYMFCLNHGMELLRLESFEERETFIRAVKLSWLELGDETFIDGIRGKDGEWQYLGSRTEFDTNIYTPSSMSTDRDETSDDSDCVALSKNNLHPEFISTSCTQKRNKFVCQKIAYQQMPNNTYDRGPFIVDVPSRILEEIGEFVIPERQKRSKYFINRDYSSSSADAINFCMNFGMKLINIDDKGELETLKRLMLKDGMRLMKNFFIGSTSSGIIENFSLSASTFADPYAEITFDLSKHCLYFYMDQLLGNARIGYTECNKHMNFICEQVEERVQGSNEYLKSYQAKLKKTTGGMKRLGVQLFDEPPKNETGYYVNDVVKAMSWFEAFMFCKAMGMDLFSPEKPEVNEHVIELLNKSGYTSSIAVGGTRIGTESFWYSTVTGVQIDADVEDDYKWCLQLAYTEDSFKFKQLSCATEIQNFMCEASEV